MGRKKQGKRKNNQAGATHNESSVIIAGSDSSATCSNASDEILEKGHSSPLRCSKSAEDNLGDERYREKLLACLKCLDIDSMRCHVELLAELKPFLESCFSDDCRVLQPSDDNSKLIETLKKDKTRLEEKLKNAEDNTKQAEIQNTELSTKVGELNKQLSGLTERLKSTADATKQEEIQNTRLATKVEELNKQLDDNKQFISKLITKTSELQKTVEDYNVKEKGFTTKISQNEKCIQQLMVVKQNLEKQNSYFTTRLSEMMNQKVCQDETDLENVNTRNRPMKILEDYELFCSNDWLIAKNELDTINKLSQKERHDLLVDILMKACERTTLAVTEVYQQISATLKHPLSSAKLHIYNEAAHGYTEEKDSNQNSSTDMLPDEIDLLINKYLKSNTDTFDYGPMAEALLNDIHQLAPYKEKETLQLNHNKILQTYAGECCKLAWKMKIQKPPMMLNTEHVNGQYDQMTHELQYGSANPDDPGAVIYYYVHPVLQHGNKVLKKGKVILHIAYSDINEVD